MKTTVRDFDFQSSGYGHYKVTYTSPKTGKQWSATISDMPLIDKTRGCDEPKRKDLEMLKFICKN
jgi:hypothetical protein